MPDFDANADLARLPAAGAGRPGRTRARPRVVLEKRALAILRYLDVVLVVLAAPVVLALGAPVLGYAVGAAVWVVQRALAQLDRRWVSRAAEPRTQLGLNLFEAFGRIWLLAGAIVAAGVIGGRADGLTAAVTIFGAYTVAFAIRVLSGPPASPRQQREAVR
ncbi:MAG: hypothetical protein ACLPUT_15275 [Solirubrobacteraceae bacterium]